MLLLSKTLSKFILPPGLFIVFMVLFLVFSFKKNSRKLNIFLLGQVLFIYILSAAPFSDAILKSLEDRYPPFGGGAAGATCVIVLSGGIMNSSPEENGMGSLTPDTLKRLAAGVRLARSLNLPLVISGGSVFSGREAESEAEAAKKLLAGMGLDKIQILEEDESRNTWENALMIKKKFRVHKAVLVTSAFHMPRSVHCFRANSMDVYPAPADYKVDRGPGTILRYLPDMGALKNSYLALREYAGYLYYLVRY